MEERYRPVTGLRGTAMTDRGMVGIGAAWTVLIFAILLVAS
jgi:hypothetical protein